MARREENSNVRLKQAGMSSLFHRLLKFFLGKNLPNDWEIKKSNKNRNFNLTDDEFLGIFRIMNESCDERDSELRDAIAYSLRLMAHEKRRKDLQKLRQKFKTTDLPSVAPMSAKKLKQSTGH